MEGSRYRRVHASALEGFQHARDDYWYRPLVFGKGLFTYLAYVPPGGSMPPHGHEEDAYELSFYMLEGELEITLEGETFAVAPGEAIHVDPGVSLGVRNSGTRTAGFLLTFAPPPPIPSPEALRERYERRGSGIKSPEEMEALIRQTPVSR
ncbi:MAG: cupin domain-containing protein [bacterium]|nr:cupin domain-containing protein [bacterium]